MISDPVSQSRSCEADNKNLDERPIKNKDHSVDALRYMLMKLPENPADLIAPSFHQMGKYVNSETGSEITQRILQAIQDEEEYDNEFEADYMGYV